MPAVTKTVNCDATRAQFVVIRIRLAVKIVNLCQLVLSAVNKCMPPVRGKRVAPVHMLNVQNHQPWMMAPHARSVERVVMANAVSVAIV